MLFMICVVVLALVSVVVSIRLIILAFQESIWWGLGTWLIPIVGLIFVLKNFHYDEVRKLFTISLVCSLLMLGLSFANTEASQYSKNEVLAIEQLNMIVDANNNYKQDNNAYANDLYELYESDAGISEDLGCAVDEGFLIGGYYFEYEKGSDGYNVYARSVNKDNDVYFIDESGLVRKDNYNGEMVDLNKE